jgi:predicted RNase H-like nuclease (RuvC/YqgF family)
MSSPIPEQKYAVHRSPFCKCISSTEWLPPCLKISEPIPEPSTETMEDQEIVPEQVEHDPHVHALEKEIQRLQKQNHNLKEEIEALTLEIKRIYNEQLPSPAACSK